MEASNSPPVADTRKDLRFNVAAATIDAAGWGLGIGLVSHATILPLFVRQLTDSPVAVGLIQATMIGGWLVPGILVSGYVERLPRVKRSVMWVAILERLMLLLMVPFCLVLGPENRSALLWAFFACWTVMNAAVGANLPGYYKLIAKTIPPALRGRVYGIGGAVSGVLGVGGAALAGWLLSAWGYPNGYAACFLGAFLIQTVSVLPLGFMREEAQAPGAAPEHIGVRKALAIGMRDRRLVWLCVAVALFSLNQMAAAFYTDFSIRRFGASPETVAGYTVVLMAVRTVAFLLVGWLGDRHGNRAAMRLATASGIVAAGIAGLAPGPDWMYAVFALNEVAVQGWGICAMNYVLELCPPQRASTYTAVFGVLSGPFRVVLPLAGGVVIAAVGFGPVFGAAVLGGCLSLLLLTRRVVEPRHDEMGITAPGEDRSVREALAED